MKQVMKSPEAGDKSFVVANVGESLEAWMREHGHEIQEAQAFSIDDLPDDPHGMGQHLSLAQGLYARMGFLLADAEAYLLRAHAVAVTETRSDHGDMTADERRVLAKGHPDYVQALRLRDNLAVIVQALKQKAFALMNGRNNADPAMSSGT